MATDLRPEPQDALVMRGITFTESYELVDPVGNAIDMTGWTLTGSINALGATSDAGAIAFVFSPASPDETGKGTYTIPGFASLPVGSYSYYLRYTDAAGRTDYAGRGLIKISDEAP